MPYKEFDISGIGKVTIYKRKGNRSLRLSVTPEGAVRVTIPSWSTYQTGLTFTMSKRLWINAQCSTTEKTNLAPGMVIGKSRKLVFVRDSTSPKIKTNVRATQVVVTLPAKKGIDDPDAQEAAQAACWRALRQESLELLAPRLRQLAITHGFTYRSINVKRMKSRWGSCDQRQNIVFNMFLIQLPWDCIDYVILHELTHTKALNHGPDFWNQFESVLPNAKQLRRKMRNYHPVLMSGAPDASMAY